MMSQIERPEFLERHYTVGELAKAWRISRETLVGWFRDEPGVIRFGTGKLKKGRQRTYVSLRVPESVARRVYRARTGSSKKGGQWLTDTEYRDK